MSTPPTNPRNASRPRPAPSAPQMAPSIDPIKLLHKYKLVLVGAFFVGMFVGIVAHFGFARFAPRYTSEVYFECLPAETNVEDISVSQVDNDEMERFMGTQVDRMKSEQVLRKVIADPRLAQIAPNWSRKYMSGSTISVSDALDDFQDMVSAYAIPRTFLIRLSVSAGNKNDAAGLAGMVKEAYLGDRSTSYNRNVVARRASLRDSIENTGTTIEELTARKARLVREERIDTVESDQSSVAGSLALVNSQLVGIQQQIEAIRVIRSQDEAQLQRETGIEYDSSLRNLVNESILIRTFQQELKALETRLIGLKSDGIQPEHRQYKQLVNQIKAHERKIEKAREELLRDAFEARLQNSITTLAQLQAQEADLLTQKEELEEELTELTRITEEISDIDRQIEAMIRLQGDQEAQLSDLQSSASLDTSRRVQVEAPETVPDFASFPKIFLMVPAGVFITMGLTAGIIVLLELLDQRVKSVSEIRAIPLIDALGMIMDAEEDPSTIESAATAFADHPNSVLAEHYRSLRTSMDRVLRNSDIRTILVVGAMPRSGATTTVTNLGQAFVASGKRVLLLDANVRRPKIRESLGIGVSPGLGDYISGKSELDACITSIDGGPDVIGAGSESARQVEHLSSEKMTELLAEFSHRYDIVLIDVAPAIVAGDAAVLANRCDASMLVVRAMAEKKGQVARLAREISDCKAQLLGAVVNGVQSAAGGYMRQNIRTTYTYHERQDTDRKPGKNNKGPKTDSDAA